VILFFVFPDRHFAYLLNILFIFVNHHHNMMDKRPYDLQNTPCAIFGIQNVKTTEILKLKKNNIMLQCNTMLRFTCGKNHHSLFSFIKNKANKRFIMNICALIRLILVGLYILYESFLFLQNNHYYHELYGENCLPTHQYLSIFLSSCTAQLYTLSRFESLSIYAL